jgi:hypothetical protein
MPLDTVETRWFFRGPLPGGAHAWLEAAAPDGVVAEPARTDRYLRLPGVDCLGVKLREGRVELKRRLETCPAASGETHPPSRWRKYGWATAEDGAFAPEADCVRVRKERWQGLWHAGGAACALELSALEAAGAPWWGMCFEATGGAGEALVLLRRVREQAFAAEGAPDLAAGQCLSYPAWLNRCFPPA